MTVLANGRLLEEIIYNYWDDYGQLGNNNPCKTGPYSSQAYKGQRNTKVTLPLMKRTVTKERTSC